MSTQMVDVYLSYLPMKQIWWKSAVWSSASLILGELMRSNYQATSPEYTKNFSKYLSWFLFKLANLEKTLFWTNQRLVFLFKCSTEKNQGKNWEKTNFVVWWFDPMSLLFVVYYDVKLENCSFVVNCTLLSKDWFALKKGPLLIYRCDANLLKWS